MGIRTRRLRAHGLTGKPFASPVDAVRRLGAVQSQDYAGAKWALGQRTRAGTDAAIDRLFDEGAILRPHTPERARAARPGPGGGADTSAATDRRRSRTSHGGPV